MSIAEIKSEINKSLDKIPENVLQDVLNYLKDLENLPSDKIERAQHLRKILNEDKNLLERLAK
jgi:mRNA-degrading endonuclease RelE of RelBE toxin-antitoxin system